MIKPLAASCQKLKGKLRFFLPVPLNDLTMTLFRKNKSKGELHQEYQCTVRFLDDSEPIQVAFTVSFAIGAWQLFSPVKMFCFFKVCSQL